MKKFLLFLSIVLSGALSAQNDISGKIDHYVNSYTTVHGFSGNILIAKKGKIIYQKSLGQANREWKIDNGPDTKFRIGSLTKQFTAAAILQLEEKDRLKTTDRLSKFFPDFPKADSITVHMLLNHTSGIRGDTGDSIPKITEINPNLPNPKLREALIGSFKDRPFEFSPGKGWSYCNSGYILLGYIIEDVTGMPYSDYIYKNIFIPAGMTQSGFTTTTNIISHLASGYNLTSGREWRKAKQFPIHNNFSAGGIYSTTYDMLKWNEALLSGKIINSESFKKMHQPNHGDFGAGYGIFIDNLYGHKIHQHQGALEGYNTYMARYPEDDICVIVLCNKDTNLDFLPKALAAILFDKSVTLPSKRKPLEISTDVAARYEGTYEGGTLPFPITVIAKDGKLYWRIHRDIELVPESETRFYVNEPDVEIQFHFTISENNKTVSVGFIDAGVRADGKIKV